ASMQNDEDQSFFIMLKKTFNPAGVPGQDARESILISAFEPADQRESQQQRSQPRQNDAGSYAEHSGGYHPDDAIPY
uniref:hypothetical protein n=1 Tax=Brucella pseudintermedia TaxID=370111 RepID=UPI00158BAB38